MMIWEKNHRVLGKVWEECSAINGDDGNGDLVGYILFSKFLDIMMCWEKNHEVLEKAWEE